MYPLNLVPVAIERLPSRNSSIIPSAYFSSSLVHLPWKRSLCIRWLLVVNVPVGSVMLFDWMYVREMVVLILRLLILWEVGTGTKCFARRKSEFLLSIRIENGKASFSALVLRSGLSPLQTEIIKADKEPVSDETPRRTAPTFNHSQTVESTVLYYSGQILVGC